MKITFTEMGKSNLNGKDTKIMRIMNKYCVSYPSRFK